MTQQRVILDAHVDCSPQWICRIKTAVSKRHLQNPRSNDPAIETLL
jgi:hypothetical protein